LASDHQGRKTLFLNGTTFYYRVALTPFSKESRAKVLRMEASPNPALAGATGLCDALAELARKVLLQ
jgi:hypothetical protein